MFDRVILMVLDSVGIGAMPDAAAYGDAGRDTLGHIAERHGLRVPNLVRLGLANIRPLAGLPAVPAPEGAFGKAALLSPGKDTTAGHWEIAGIILERPFPTYPKGFPREIMEKFEQAIGRKVIGNKAASGTENSFVVISKIRAISSSVIPAKAGIHLCSGYRPAPV